MASHIQNANVKNFDHSPRTSYTITYTATRNGSSVTYTFTIECYLHGNDSAHLGNGIGLKATLTINGASNSVTLKSTSNDYWGDGGNGDTGVLYATKTVSVTCQSTTGQENQIVKFVVDRTDSGGSTGKVSTSDYYVISPVYYTACTAPTSFVATPELYEDTFTLTWSGAKGGTSNAITGYQCQFRSSKDGVTWGSWYDSSVDGSGQTVYGHNNTRGYYHQYRVRAKGSAGVDFYSDWTESNPVRRNSLPGKPSNPSISAAFAASGDVITVSWASSSDPDGNHNGYRLAKSVNSGEKETISGGGSTSCNVTVSGAPGDVIQFFVRAEDTLGATSDWLEIGSITICGSLEIFDGENWNRHAVFIFDGTAWQQYTPYIFDGTEWQPHK